MTTLHTTIQRVSLGLLATLALTHVSYAAPIRYLTGGLTVTVGAPPLENNPNLLYPDNTVGNEIGFILTDNSNADVRISNVAAPTIGGKSNPITSAVLSGEDECVGTILAPGGTCGYYVIFDTGNIAPNITQAAFIQDSVSGIFFTTKTDGVQPLRAVRSYSKVANITVYDSSISTDDPLPGAVPEPQVYALIGSGLIAIGLVGRHRKVTA